MQTVLVFKFVFSLTSIKKDSPTTAIQSQWLSSSVSKFQFFETLLIDRVTDQQ